MVHDMRSKIESVDPVVTVPDALAKGITIPRHVAILMDGNGRWAHARGLDRSLGHRAGVEAARIAVKTAGQLRIPILTLFGFSSENWARPEQEISNLIDLFRNFVQSDLQDLVDNGVRVVPIGERDNLDEDILYLLRHAEKRTRHNSRLVLNVAFNYGGRNEIARAARKIAERVEAGTLTSQEVSEGMFETCLDTAGLPDPDLIIRTSGEQRLSNFLLWQAAYSELVFLDCYWPDFNAIEFIAAIKEFNGRERRFGAAQAIVA